MTAPTPRRSTDAQARVSAASKAAKPAAKTTKAAKPVAKTAKAAKPAPKTAKPAAKATKSTKPAAKTTKAAKPLAKTTSPVKKAPVKKAAVRKAPVTRAAASKATAAKTTATKRAPRAMASTAVESAPVAAPAVQIAGYDLVAAPASQKEARGVRRRLVVAGGLGLAVILLGGVAAFALRNPAPSKASYIAKADLVCRPGNGPVTAIVRPTSYPELSTVSGTVVTATSAEMEQLDHLRRPAGDDGKQAEAAVKSMATYNAAAKTLREAADKKDDAATIAATKSLKAAYADAKTKTTTYGFTACGFGMQPGIDTTVDGATGVIKTEFIAKADGLCRAAATKFDALPTTPDSDAGLIADLNGELGITQKLVADLRTLPVAPGDEPVVTQMLDAADKLNAKTVELRDAVVAQDFARFQAALKEGGPINTDSDHQFDAYGLGVCGSNFGA